MDHNDAGTGKVSLRLHAPYTRQELVRDLLLPLLDDSTYDPNAAIRKYRRRLDFTQESEN